MAIARDTSAILVDDGTLTSATTYPYTVTGANPLLIAAVFMRGQTTDLITDLKYAGVSMSRIAYLGNKGNSREIWLYVLSAPTAGLANVQATYSADGALGSIYCASYTGAAAFVADGVDASILEAPTGVSSSTIPITTVADNCWTFTAAQSEFTSLINAGAGTNLLQRGTGVASYMIGDSNAAVTPAGLNNMTVTSSGLDTLKSITISFAPVSTARRFLLVRN